MTRNPKVAALHRKTFIALALGLLVGGEVGCHRSRVADFEIVYAADQLGYLAPCGCSQHQLGGAARASQLLQGIADAGPALFVEGGDFLFDDLKISPEKQPQARDKAVALLKSWQTGLAGMRATAWATGPFDDSLGADFRQSTLAGEPLLAAPRLVELDGVKLGLVNLPDGAGAADPQAVEGLRHQGARLVIAVAHGTMAQASEWAEKSGADVALQSGVVDPVLDTDEAARVSGGVPVFRVKDKGRGILVLHVHVPKGSGPGLAVLESADAHKGQAEEIGTTIASYKARLKVADPALRKILEQKIPELEQRQQALLAPPPAPPSDKPSVAYRFVDLTDELREAAPAAAIFKDYTRELAQKNLAAQAGKVCPAVAPGQLHFTGASDCETCHADAYKVYAHTKHPNAYRTLKGAERQYDLDCINCHVVGFGKPGGVCRLDQVGALGGVQCESCHGMGALHAESGGGSPIPSAKPGYDTCYKCHDPENDTGFNRESYVSHYLPEILGPGHGKPLKPAR